MNVAILDGFVMARSGMHHSVNSRSVTLYGTAFKVEDPDEKLTKLSRFVNGLFPGRYEGLRPDHAQDLKATMLLGMKIEEGAAKEVRDALLAKGLRAGLLVPFGAPGRVQGTINLLYDPARTAEEGLEAELLPIARSGQMIQSALPQSAPTAVK